MNWFGKTMKYNLYAFNCAFMFCGLFLVTMGGILLSNLTQIKALKDDESTAALPISIIVLGCVLFVVSLLGFFGAIRENVWCIYIYTMLMFIFFCLELGFTFFILLTRQEFVHSVTKVVIDAWLNNNESNGYPLGNIEVKHNCCGINGYEDYLHAGLQVSSSCCGFNDVSRECLATVYENKRGCKNKFYDFWSTSADILIYSSIGIAVVELFAFLCAYFFARSLRKFRHSK